MRVKLTTRVDPDMLQLGRKLAKQMYGSEKRIGYVIDDSIRLLHLHQTEPKQAEAYLSNIENLVIRNLEKRIEAVGRHAVESMEKHLERANKRIGNLYAREVYDSIKTYLMVEELCYRAMSDFKEVKPKIEKEAAQRMKRKLQFEGEQEGATYAEENAQLREEVEKLRRKLEQVKEYLNKQKQEEERWEADRRRLDKQYEEAKRVKQERDQIAAWTRGLVTYMKENYSRVKTNEKLIEEYIRDNPKPKGV